MTGYESTEEASTDTTTDDATTVDDGNDDFGYSKDKTEETTPAESESKDKEAESTEEIPETKLEGYGKESETEETKVEDKPEDKKEETEEEKTDAEKLKVDLTESIKALPEGYDKEKVLDFATKHGFSNAQIKAYVEMENVARSDHDASSKIAVADQKKAWATELRDDKEFGGDNFNRNIHQVEKTLSNHFPNLGKNLTDRGGMMPPYLMRDMLALSKVLNPTNSLVTGDASTPPPKEENFLDDMYK